MASGTIMNPEKSIKTGQLTELISFQSSGKVNTIQKQGNLVIITFYATFAAGMSAAYQPILQIPDEFAPPSGSHFGIVGIHNNTGTVFVWVEYANDRWCINYGVKASANAYTTFQIIYLTD